MVKNNIKPCYKRLLRAAGAPRYVQSHIQIHGAAASVSAERSAREKADGAFAGRWIAVLTHRLPGSRWADTICICAVPVKVTEWELRWWLRGHRIHWQLSGCQTAPLLLGRDCPPAAKGRNSPSAVRAGGWEKPCLGFFPRAILLIRWVCWGLGSSWAREGGFFSELPNSRHLLVRQVNSETKYNFQNKSSAAKGKPKYVRYLLRKKAVLLWDNPTLVDQKACWEEVVVILDSENRPVYLKPTAKKSVCVSWMLIISYSDV